MNLINVNLGERTYRIVIGPGAIGHIGEYLSDLNAGTDIYVITNAAIHKLYGNRLTSILKKAGYTSRYKLIPDSERSKSMRVVLSVIKDIAEYDRKRRLCVAAFGGGVIGDCAGFIASVYKRGIPYVQIPTTLLAQVDSSIGGKTGVDLPEGKNLVGSFYQPRLVLSDLDFISSLSSRQVCAGFAEIIKYACIRDELLFSFLEKNIQDERLLNADVLEYIVTACSRIKAAIVSQDERERARDLRRATLFRCRR